MVTRTILAFTYESVQTTKRCVQEWMYRCASTNSVQAVQKIKKKKGGAGVTCRKMSTTCRYTRFLACNTFNVLVLVQETMQKIVSDNLLACYIIYISAKRAEKNRYRVTNRLLVDEAKDAVLLFFFSFFFVEKHVIGIKLRESLACFTYVFLPSTLYPY